jgi:uncharacterized protein YjbJ (UPF0337 family)
MDQDKKEGIIGQLKGWTNIAMGTVTGNDERKMKGDVQLIEGSNRKDLADQKENLEEGATDIGNSTNT